MRNTKKFGHRLCTYYYSCTMVPMFKDPAAVVDDLATKTADNCNFVPARAGTTSSTLR